MKYWKWFVGFGLITLTACSGKSGDKTPLARSGNVQLTVGDFEKELAAAPPLYRKYLSTTEGKKEFLEMILKEKVLIEEAKRAGIGNRPDVQKRLKEFQENVKREEEQFHNNLMVREFLRELQDKELKVSEADLQSYYDQNKDRFENPTRVEASHILVSTEEELQLFEKEFAQYCEAQYAIGVDSGTGALELALHALGIKAGDEVLVPVFTFYATASSVASVGAKPVFIDVEEDTGNIDPNLLKKAITPRTKAIIPVHLFGQPANLAEIRAVAQAHNLHLIEDSAQAHGATLKIDGKWRRVGGLGVMGCFSFYPGKNLGAYGDGGMIVTQSAELVEKLKLLRDYGRTGKYEHATLGFNRRLDNLQAAVLRVKLKKLNSWNAKRAKLGEKYDQAFAKMGIQTFSIRPFATTVRHVYSIRAPRRDDLAKYLNDNGVATGVHYPIPLHLQKAFAGYGYAKGSFPNAEKLSTEVLALPVFPELTAKEQNRVIQLIKSFYEHK